MGLLPQLESCCCVGSLRTGSIVAGWWGAVSIFKDFFEIFIFNAKYRFCSCIIKNLLFDVSLVFKP